MGNNNALGGTGRARGVDDVSGVVRGDPASHRKRVRLARVHNGDVDIEVKSRDHRDRGSVRERGADALCRVVRVDRQISRTRLNDRESSNGKVRATG
ncbi:hypothetical protein Aglo03_14760 [Actinokineospora globicatena]|uniref:Uncharacterized protein n=1 Tax=Actinokineospora globicatena TaxID=103729 RepID=A0A9W6QJ64_9PSEU|nr:hypothetical protein Aglo03_14760 [Actinokineospora globicatena]